jgi:transcriptional regulator with XRE-family HTH domain
MKSTRELLGARIKELRKACKLSQEELAEMIGVEPQHLSRIESGRSYPSIDRLERISMALHVPLKDFFEYMHLEDASERSENIGVITKDLSEERQRFAFRMIKALQDM